MSCASYMIGCEMVLDSLLMGLNIASMVWDEGAGPRRMMLQGSMQGGLFVEGEHRWLNARLIDGMKIGVPNT